MRKKKGWSNYNTLQSKRHSNAKKYGKAGGKYASTTAPKKMKPVSMSVEANIPSSSPITIPEKDSQMDLFLRKEEAERKGKKAGVLIDKLNALHTDFLLDKINSETYLRKRNLLKEEYDELKIDIEKELKLKAVKPLSDRQKQNQFYEDYVLDSISNEGYDDAKPLKTPKEKLQFLKDTFRSEYSFMIERVGERKAFEEWIAGLPSSFNIEFMNYEILKLAKKSGSLPENATDKQEDRVLENYWNFISVKTFQAFNKYDVK